MSGAFSLTFSITWYNPRGISSTPLLTTFGDTFTLSILGKRNFEDFYEWCVFIDCQYNVEGLVKYFLYVKTIFLQISITFGFIKFQRFRSKELHVLRIVYCPSERAT